MPMNVDIDLIHTGQWTERLLQSDIPEEAVVRARLYGLHEDVHLRSLPHRPGHYEILGSPRTWLIAQLIQQPAVPVKLMDHLSLDEIEGYYEPLTVPSDHFIDRAKMLRTMIRERGISLADAGRMTGKSRAEVCNMMRVLKMDEQILEKIRHCPKVKFGHARIMAGLGYEQQQRLLEKIRCEGLSVQQSEAVARALRQGGADMPAGKKEAEKSADVLRLETLMSEHFGARVAIREKQGLLEINYHHDLDILQGILEKMGIEDL